MATATRSLKSAPATLPTVRSKDDLETAVADLGTDLRALSDLDTLIAREVARVKAEFSDRKKDLQKRLEKRGDRIARYCQAHRTALIGGQAEKTVALASGIVSWYFGPTAVVCDDDEPVIEWCRENAPADTLRVTVTLDREYIEKNRETLEIPGIEFEQGEFLKVVPNGHEDGIKRKLRTLSVVSD